MKVLVSGCSFSAGRGFPGGINDPEIWPNVLGQMLNAEVTNVSEVGYDNTGIFINGLKELSAKDYDLILFQITAFDRVVLSPTVHGHRLVSWRNIVPSVSDKAYEDFHKVFLEVNGGYEHWRRLVNMLVTLQNLVKQGYNIKILNGLLLWDQDFFSSSMSKFTKNILNVESLPDDDIEKFSKIVNQDKQQIDLSLWINPFDCLALRKIDDAPIPTGHPGPRSARQTAELICQFVNK